MAEIKIIKCLRGSVFDVMVDLRAGSATLLEWHSEILSAENQRMLYLPEGMAHGFQTLEEGSELLYLHSQFYSPDDEGAIRFDDPKVGIEWPLPVSEISDKDRQHALLHEDFAGFNF